MTAYAWKNGLTPQECVVIVEALTVARAPDQLVVPPIVRLAAQLGTPAAVGGCAIPFVLRIGAQEIP